MTFGWRNGTSYNYRCLGSIITRHMVITTRSCLEDGKPDVVIINEKNNMFPVGDVRFHDSYHATDSSFDIALVEVSKPFTWTSHVFPNCLWTNKTHTPLVMRRIYVSGNVLTLIIFNHFKHIPHSSSQIKTISPWNTWFPSTIRTASGNTRPSCADRSYA